MIIKIITLVLMILICFSLGACEQNSLKIKDNISMEAKFSEVNSYKNYVPIKNANDVIKIEEIILPQYINEMKFSCSGIINSSNIIVVLYTEVPVIVHEIGLYNFKTDSYKTLIELNENTVFEICTYNEEYIILRMSEDEWKTCQLYYLNFEQLNLINFFSYSIDPNKNTMYTFNDNSIAIIDGKIYFDDFYMDSSGEIRIRLYEYTIQNQKLALIAEDAQNPMAYNGNIVFFKKNKEGKFKNIVSSNNNLILSNTKHLLKITANNDGFYCIENANTNYELKTTLFQLTDLTKDKPILSTYSPISNLRSSDRFITWTNYYDEKPYIYDTYIEQLLLFSDIDAGINNYFFIKDIGVLLNTKKDNNRLFIFTPYNYE